MTTKQVKKLAREAVGLTWNSHWIVTKIEWCGSQWNAWLVRIENRHATAWTSPGKREKWVNVWPNGRIQIS